MDGNCHFIFGASVGAMTAINLDSISSYLPAITSSPEMKMLFILGGLIGGIFPDIDNPGSHIGKLSVPVSSIIGKISEGFGKTGVNHRGILHDPTIYIVGLVLSYFYYPPLLGFLLGCITHLLLDMFNPSGIPFMLGARLRLAKIKSGSKGSIILTWVATGLVVLSGVCVKLNYLQ